MVPANKQSQFSINMWPSQHDRKPQECVIVTCCLNPSFGHTISLDFFSDSSASAHGLLPLQMNSTLKHLNWLKNTRSSTLKKHIRICMIVERKRKATHCPLPSAPSSSDMQSPQLHCTITQPKERHPQP
jgi:hypothetical protein